MSPTHGFEESSSSKDIWMHQWWFIATCKSNGSPITKSSLCPSPNSHSERGNNNDSHEYNVRFLSFFLSFEEKEGNETVIVQHCLDEDSNLCLYEQGDPFKYVLVFWEEP